MPLARRSGTLTVAPQEEFVARSSPLPSHSASPITHRKSGNRRTWWIAAVVIVALLAAAAGVFAGRALRSGGGTRSAASWRALPKAAIAGRLSPGAVWTGKEMIVWGGVARSGMVRAASDGAAYDPATRTWRTIAQAPAGLQGDGGAGVVWTGREMVVWASSSPDGPFGTGAYDASTDTWRRLPAGPLGWREGYSSAWTGKELIVVGGSLGDSLAKPVAAALDPKTGSWRPLPALEKFTGLMPSPGVVWDGHEVWVMGSVCARHLSSCSPTLLAYHPAADALRKIDLSRAPIAPQQQLRLIASSGSDLVFSTVGLANGRILLLRYHPATDTWRRGSFAPFPVPDTAYTQTAWLGDRYLVADGSSGLQIYSLDTDTWQTITPGPSPLNAREGSAIVWTGHELIAWSGTVYEKFNPTPADGASLTLEG